MNSQRVSAASAVLALSIVVLIPSSAASEAGVGGLTPVIAALVVQVLGLVVGHRAMRFPPGFAWAVVGFALMGIGAADSFASLLPVVGILQYTLVWSAAQAYGRGLRNWVIGVAVAEGILSIAEATVIGAPIIGVARTIDAENPFFPTLLRSQGTLGHPLVLALLLLVGLALTASASDMRPRYRVPAAVLLTAGSFFTGSSTVVVVGAVIILGFLLLRRGIAAALYTGLLVTIGALWLTAARAWPTFLTDDLNERTAQHRLNAIAAIPSLFSDRPPGEVFFGSGSITELYSRGVLINDGFYTVDNQFVSTFALTGLIGVIATSVFVGIVIARTRNRLSLVAYLVFLLSGASFDFLLWYVGITLFFSVAALTQAPRPHRPRSQDGDERQPVHLDRGEVSPQQAQEDHARRRQPADATSLPVARLQASTGAQPIRER